MIVRSAAFGDTIKHGNNYMIRSWISSQYLGHTNLKNALDAIARSVTNVVLSQQTPMIIYPTTQSGIGGLGGYLRVVGTFLYRIGDSTYIKGVGITGLVNTGDATSSLLRHDSTEPGTTAGPDDITATYYRAGVLLIDANGVFSSICAADAAGATHGVKVGGRMKALAYLVDTLDTSDIEDKSIVCFFVIGDGTNAFTSTSTLTIDTDLDLYQCGGMTLSSGQSTDGLQLLGLI